MQWFHTTEVDDVISSLKVLRDTIQKVDEDPHYWKWVILSLHSAAQGAIVCHLSGSMQIGALTAKSAADVRRSSEADFDGASQTERMAPPRELFRRLSEESGRLELAGGVIDCSAEETFFLLVCSMRDEFTHFTPKHWVVGLSALPTTIEIMMRLIERIAEAGWAFRQINPDEVMALTTSIRDFSSKLSCKNA